MEWTEVIVANLVTFALAMLGVIVAIVIYKKDKRHMRDTKTINKLATQVKAYYELEQVYMEEMAKTSNTAPKTIQQNFRKNVLENHPDIQLGGKWISSQVADSFIRF